MQSKAMKNFMAKLYGFGAAIVITGAMFKIMHWPGSGVMLVCGLSTEAIIFFFSAFEKPHDEVDWSLVYPQLAMGHDDDTFADEDEEKEKKEKEGTISQQLDQMLAEAKVEPELISNLGTGLKSFSDNVASMANLADSSLVTQTYNENVKKATTSVTELTETYSKGDEAMKELTGISTELKSHLSEVSGSTNQYNESIKSAGASLDTANNAYSKAATAFEELANTASTEATASYNEQIKKVNQSLSSLNSLYEMELQESETHLKSIKDYYSGVTQVLHNINNSIEDTKIYKEQIAQLNQHIATLNAVYGSMLTAMRAPLKENLSSANINNI